MNRLLDPVRPRFSLHELSGAFGDLGTFLPLAVGMASVSGIDFGAVLVVSGLMNVATGLLFRQPIPVQPMKAIAAVAITERLAAGEVLAAGVIMGVLVTVLGVSGFVEGVARRIPRAIVRGILLGLGVKLAWQGLSWGFELPVLSADSVTTALASGGALALLAWRKLPAALLVFAGGFAIQAWASPEAFSTVALALPSFHAALPSEPASWWNAGVKAVLPQLPLTLLNSVVAVCSLSTAYFPQRGIRPRDMAVSVGLMNLVGVPLGSFPLCHGSGGLAAQYRFGARTGGSVIMLGVLKLVIGLLFGGTLLALMAAYPRSVLGPMLVVSGIELARVAWGEIRAGGFVIAVGTTAGCVAVSTSFGLGVGLALVLVQKTPAWSWALARWYRWRGGPRRPGDQASGS